jgi:hypothetical protein
LIWGFEKVNEREIIVRCAASGAPFLKGVCLSETMGNELTVLKKADT